MVRAFGQWIIILLALNCAASGVEAGSDPAVVDSRGEVLSNVPQEARKLEAAIGSWQGSFETTLTATGNAAGTTKKVTRADYFFNPRVGGGLLVTTSVFPKVAKGPVVGFNNEYDFSLLRTPSQQQYYIHDYNPRPRALPPLRRAFDSECLTPLLAAEDFCGVLLPQILDGTRGSLVSVTPVEFAGRPCLRLDCYRRLQGNPKNYPGSAIIDPGDHWAIMRYEQRYDWGVMRQTNQYGRLAGGVAFPQRVLREDVTNDGRIVETHDTTFGQPEPCDANAERFTLNAFNLEPPHLASRSRILFLALNSAVLLLLGIWLTYLAYKRWPSAPGGCRTETGLEARLDGQ